jgi:uncharacterized membrane protein
MKKYNVVFVLLSAIVSIMAYPTMPSRVPMHWNMAGEINSWMPKSQAVWFFPLMIAAMWLMFSYLPKLDPKHAKYNLFDREWSILQSGFLGFFLYMQIITFYISHNVATAITPWMLGGIGVLFMLIGNYLSKIRQNYFIGVKLPWTLASEDNWNKTHRFAGLCFFAAGLLTFIGAFAVRLSPYIIFISIMLAAFLPMVYSYYLFRREK